MRSIGRDVRGAAFGLTPGKSAARPSSVRSCGKPTVGPGFPSAVVGLGVNVHGQTGPGIPSSGRSWNPEWLSPSRRPESTTTGSTTRPTPGHGTGRSMSRRAA